MPLKVVEMLGQVIIRLDSPQIPIMTHGNGEEENIGNEIRRRS